MIGDMIAKLEKEQAEAVEFKKWCDNKIAEATRLWTFIPWSPTRWLSAAFSHNSHLCVTQLARVHPRLHSWMATIVP